MHTLKDMEPARATAPTARPLVRTWRGFGLAALALGACHAANALVLYDNGAPDQVWGTQMSEVQIAEDFALGAAANISNIHFWSDLSAAADYTGSVYWAIYGNAAGAPGALVQGGVVAAVAAAATGGSTGFGYAEYAFDIPVAFTLVAGTYWLGLHNGPLVNTTASEMLWGTTTAAVGSSGLYWDGTTWISSGNEHAFRLDGAPVPEPSTLALWLGGLLAVGALRRKSH